MQNELVGVDVRLKEETACLGRVIEVADAGAQGVKLRVQSREGVVEFPAASLEAIAVTDGELTTRESNGT